MRIVILSTLYPPIVQGGAEKAAALLAEALARSGDRVAVITLHPGREQIAETLNGVRVYRVPQDNIYWPFDARAKPPAAIRFLWHLRDAWNRKAARRVGRILDIEKPDVVHTHGICGFSVAVWKEAKKRGIRLVHTTHDYYLMCLRSDMFPGGSRCEGNCIQCRVGTAGRRYWANRVDHIVSVSNFVLEQHRSRGYISHDDCSVGYNVSPASVRSPRIVLPPVGEDLIFGFIGRLEEQKGIGVLLEATRLLKRAGWRLRVAGRGREEYVETLRQRYPDSRIEWLGYTDAPGFYASIHVTVLPSVWDDPLPYVAIESLQHGKSLIAAQSGGIPEIAALGRVVETFTAGDVPGLAATMDRALEDVSRWCTGGFADEASRQLFSEDAVVARHRALYSGQSPQLHERLTLMTVSGESQARRHA